MPTTKSAQKSRSSSKPEQAPGPFQGRAKRFLDANMPKGKFALTRLNWNTVCDHLDRLRKLEGKTDDAVVIVSDSEDAYLAAGVAPASGTVDYEASFGAFFRSAVRNRNRLGSRSVRLGLADGGGIFLMPIGGPDGSFEDVFRPSVANRSGTGIAGVLAELSLLAADVGEAAERANEARRDAMAAAEMTEEASARAKASAAEAKEASKAVEDISQRANAAKEGLEESLDRVQRTTAKFRAMVFGDAK